MAKLAEFGPIVVVFGEELREDVVGDLLVRAVSGEGIFLEVDLHVNF
jgi:hypothetical protein